jgi:ABC-type polysaccharide/polyol phosphate transport system ATPase subunit
MHMRLAFATAVVVEPEILLIDEILAVGDEAFARKSFNRIRELQRHDRTIVVVSHSLELLNTLCTRLVWLNEGKIIESGPPGEVIAHYLAATNAPAPTTP